jgi:D-proline reductase (dithiol) PrdB
VVRMADIDPEERKFLEAMACPTSETQSWVTGPPLDKRRVAVISTAGLHQRDDRPFMREPGDFYRIIPGDVQANSLVMSHLSVNYDRSGFYQDWNVAFPIDRLRELAAAGIIGSVAGFHYSFMGADDPMRWQPPAHSLAAMLHRDKVNAVLLIPV